MNNFDKNVVPAGLNEELAALVKKNKWNIKAAHHLFTSERQFIDWFDIKQTIVCNII